MARRRIPWLDWDEISADELAAHGLTIEDALDVARYAPELMRQKRKPVIRSDGSLYEQPARLKLIGPDAGGRLLTFIIEYPDVNQSSRIVTGWLADDEERAKYRQRRGGHR